MPLPPPTNINSATCASLGFSVRFSFLIAPYGWYSSPYYYYIMTEGFTFSLLTTPDMGQGGNHLGYGGLTGLAVEFDTNADVFDPVKPSGAVDENHIGIDIGGNLTSVATSPAPIQLAWAWDVLKHAVIEYDPTTQLLSVLVSTDSQSAWEPALTQYVDLCSALNLQSTTVAPPLYVGFTGGSSHPPYIGKYLIYDWQVSTGEECVLQNTPALPSTLWLNHDALKMVSCVAAVWVHQQRIFHSLSECFCESFLSLLVCICLVHLVL